MFAFDCCVPRRLFALVAMAEAKRRVYPETSFCSRSNGGSKPTPAESGVFLLSEHAGKQIDDNAKGRRFAPFCSRSMRGSKSPTTSGGVFLRLEQWRKAINPTGPAGDVISLANHAGQHTTRAAETQRQLHQKCCPPPCRRPNPFPGFFSWIFPRFFLHFSKRSCPPNRSGREYRIGHFAPPPSPQQSHGGAVSGRPGSRFRANGKSSDDSQVFVVRNFGQVRFRTS